MLSITSPCNSCTCCLCLVKMTGSCAHWHRTDKSGEVCYVVEENPATCICFRSTVTPAAGKACAGCCMYNLLADSCKGHQSCFPHHSFYYKGNGIHQLREGCTVHILSCPQEISFVVYVMRLCCRYIPYHRMLSAWLLYTLPCWMLLCMRLWQSVVGSLQDQIL